jgi:hypothetical protein
MELRIARSDCKQFLVASHDKGDSKQTPCIVSLSTKELAAALSNTKESHQDCDIVIEVRQGEADGSQPQMTVSFVKESDSKVRVSRVVKLQSSDVCASLVRELQAREASYSDYPMTSKSIPSKKVSHRSMVVAASEWREVMYRMCLFGMSPINSQPGENSRMDRYTSQVTLRTAQEGAVVELASRGATGTCTISLTSHHDKSDAARRETKSQHMGNVDKCMDTVFAAHALVQVAECAQVAPTVQIRILQSTESSSNGSQSGLSPRLGWSWTYPMLQQSHLRWLILS